MKADIRILGGGAVYFLQPANNKADDWLEENLPQNLYASAQGYAVPSALIDGVLVDFVKAGFRLSSAGEVC